MFVNSKEQPSVCYIKYTGIERPPEYSCVTTNKKNSN